MSLEIGSKVVTGTGAAEKKGVVKFIGLTQFATGDWVGIRLDNPEGKNDGSVGGERYFECEPLHGLFVKQAQVRLDRDFGVQDTQQKLAALRERRKKREEEEKVSAITSVNTPSRPSQEASLSSFSPVKPTETSALAASSMKPLVAIIASPVLSNKSTTSDHSSPNIQISEKNNEITTLQLPVQPLISEAAIVSAVPISTLQAMENEKNKIIESLQNQLNVQSVEMKSLTNSLDHLTKTNETASKTFSSQEFEYKKEIIALKESLEKSSQVPVSTPPEQISVPTQSNNEINLLKEIENLKSQVSELNDAIEMLSLDKEQLLVEKELNEEMIAKLQSDQQTYIANSTLGTDASKDSTTINLNDENNKLREALKRLHQVTATETTQLKSELQKIENELKIYKTTNNDLELLKDEYNQIKDENTELKQIVDSAGAYESMIENLTQINLDLTIKIQQSQASLQDLESEQELMEELDARQRNEIDNLRKDVDTMSIHMNQSEKQIQLLLEKIDENKKNNEKYNQIIEEQKQEILHLSSQLLEYKELSKSQEKRSKDVTDVKLAKVSLQEELMFTKKYICYMETKIAENSIILNRYKTSFQTVSLFTNENIISNADMRLSSLAYTASHVCIQLQSTFSVIPSWIESITSTNNTSTSSNYKGEIMVASIKNMNNHVVNRNSFDLIKLHNMLLLTKSTCLIWQAVVLSIFETSTIDESTVAVDATLPTVTVAAMTAVSENTVSSNIGNFVQSTQFFSILEQVSVWLGQDELNYTKDVAFLTNNLNTLLTFNNDIETTLMGYNTNIIIPRTTEIMSIDDSECNIIIILLQISLYLYESNIIINYLSQSTTSEHSQEYINSLNNLKTETHFIQEIIVCGTLNNKDKVTLRKNIIQIRNILFSSKNILNRTVELNIHGALGNSNTLDSASLTHNSILRQALMSVHEATIICKDIFDSLNNISSKMDDIRIGDILLMKHSIMKLFDVGKFSDNNNTSSNNNSTQQLNELLYSLKIFPFYTNANDKMSLFSFSQPHWKIRCQNINTEILKLEHMKSQYIQLSTHNRQLENELSQRKDELKAALSRCEELSTVSTTTAITTVSMKTPGKNVKIDGKGMSEIKKNNNDFDNNSDYQLLKDALNSLEKRYELLEKENKLLKTTSKTSSIHSSKSNPNIHMMDSSNNSLSIETLLGTGQMNSTKGNKGLSVTNIQSGGSTTTAAFDIEMFDTLKRQLNEYKQVATNRLTESLMPLPATDAVPWLNSISSSATTATTTSSDKTFPKTIQEKLNLANRLYCDTRSIRASIRVCDITERKQSEHMLSKGYTADLVEEYLRELTVVAAPPSTIASY